MPTISYIYRLDQFNGDSLLSVLNENMFFWLIEIVEITDEKFSLVEYKIRRQMFLFYYYYYWFHITLSDVIFKTLTDS